ncbi:MAG: lipocalin family protein [Clostridia bacterium]|nr:lipocalin family protein [Clostridia bacterium]
MVCKNCGAKIGENEKYCITCGVQNDIAVKAPDKSAENKTGNKRLYTIVGAITAVLLLVILIATVGGKPEKKIVGTWQMTEKSQEQINNSVESTLDSIYTYGLGIAYPGPVISFGKDGQCTENGDASGAYVVENGVLTLYSSSWFSTVEISYKISITGNKL